MSTIVNLNGVSYVIPSTGEVGWGQDLHNYLVATASGGLLQLEGGAFTLTSDVNFGPNFGLQSPYYKGQLANPAQSGTIRLANTENVSWRNDTNTADLALELIGDTLYFAGVPVGAGGGASPLTTKGDLYTFSTFSTRLPVGINGQVLLVDSSTPTGLKWGTVGGSGSGTVTGVSVVTANGVSGSVSNPTTTPAITLTLGAITPSSVASTGTVTGTNLSGTNTGDQTITLTGAITGSGTGSFSTTYAGTVPISKGGTGATTQSNAINALLPSQTANAGKVLYTDGTNVSWQAVSGGSGVSSISGTQGVTVANPTTTPVIGLGAITPTSVAATGTVTGSNITGSVSGTNTGDQTINLTGDVTGSGTSTFATTLSTVPGLVAGAYSLATVTVDTKGRVTAIANGSAGTGTVTSVGISGTADITVGGGPITSSGTLTVALSNTGTPGTYNNVTTDSKGRVTSGSNVGYITGNQTIILSGDISGSGTTGIVATLPSTGVVAGSYSLANIIVDSKGRITAASNGSVGGVTSITAGTGLSGGTITSTGTIALANTAVTAGSYTLASITVDAQGRITSASSGGTSVSNVITTSATTAVGINAAVGITSAFYNTAMGNNALRVTTTGQYNSAFGDQSMRNNTGNSNSAFGYLSLYTNTTGFSNTAVGREALYSTQTTGQNTAIGSGAGYNITGSNNTALGYQALWASTTGSNNTAIGYAAASSTTTVSNEITLGNSSVATLRCQVTSITALSDARDKTDIKPLTFGLDFVNELAPVAFTWNMRDGGKVGIKSSGFIAQDLKATQEKFNAKETLNLVMEENPEKLEATYGHLIPVLVKAIQELSAEVTALKQQLNT